MKPWWILGWAQPEPELSSLQAGSWLLALVLAMLSVLGVIAVRKRRIIVGGSSNGIKRLGSTRLNARVSLELVEFEDKRLLLSVSDNGAQIIAQAAVQEVDHAPR